MDREGKASDLVHHLLLLHVADVNGGLVGCQSRKGGREGREGREGERRLMIED